MPGLDGMATDQVRLKTPVPTYVQPRLLVFAALVEASASQSRLPPKPLASVTVTVAPVTAVVMFGVNVGGELTVNVSGAEVPPPGAGVKTVTCAVPRAAMSSDPIDACNCVALTKVVGRLAPFQRTMEDDMNLLPVTASVNAVPPTAACEGESALAIGAGFSDGSTVRTGLVATRV